MVNWEHVEAVLCEIDADRAGFDMSHWEFTTSCGTTRCIAGWAVEMRGRELESAGRPRNGFEYARAAIEYFDLPPRDHSRGDEYSGYARLFSSYAFDNTHAPTTDDIRARIKEFDCG